MQGRSSVDGKLYSWLTDAADFGGAFFTGPGPAEDVAIYARPVKTPQIINPVRGSGAGSLASLLAQGVGSITSYPLSGFTAALPTWFRDTGGRMTAQGTAPNDYYVKDPFARVVVLLPGTSTSLTVEAVNFTPGNNADPRDTVGVRTSTSTSGAGLSYNQTIQLSATTNVKQQFTITLPAGTRYVELTEAAAITGVSAAQYAIALAPAVQRQLVVFGDSIGGGNKASPTFLGMYQNAARYTSRFDGVDIYCISGDSLAGHGNLTTLAAALVSRAQLGAVERKLFVEIVTNDYGLNVSTAATYESRMGTLLDLVHASDPSIGVYLLQAAHRSTIATGGTVAEGANGLGSTLADFRNSAANVQATRSSWVTLIDGFNFWSLSAIASGGDGLHPFTSLMATAGGILVPLL